MSTITPQRVYQGFWVDQSEGQVLGQKITTTTDRANVVVAALSISIAFAGAHLWDLIAFCYFISQATRSACDAMHHQRQTLLRNNSTPLGVMLKVAEMYWQWRNHTTRPFKRLIYLFIMAIICSFGFLVAGILSSLVVSTTNILILASSTLCGFVDMENSYLAGSYVVGAVHESMNYASRCYNGSRSDPACQVFTAQTIPLTCSYTNCPFNDTICFIQNSDEQALHLDTGHLWSDQIFGINSRQEDALSLRKVTTCAPLNLTQFLYIIPMREDYAQEIFNRPAYVDEKDIQWHLGHYATSGNATFYVSSAKIDTNGEYDTDIVYSGSANEEMLQIYPWEVGNWWDPLPLFRKVQGDVAVVLVSDASQVYAAPINDPVFGAHKPVVKQSYATDGTSINQTFYSRDGPAGFIGCLDQFQFCVKAGGCTNLTDSQSAAVEATRLNLSTFANVTLFSFVHSIVNLGGYMPLLSTLLPEIPLLAKDDYTHMGQVLPIDQWELEVKNWQAIILTYIQKTMSDVAAGQGLVTSANDTLAHYPPGPVEDQFCHAQKMMAPYGFSNINVFGLSFIVSICGAIILANTTLKGLLLWVPWKKQQQFVGLEQWGQDDILTFQRLAYESNGIGTWKGTPHRVPITDHKESFVRLADAADTSSTSSTTYSNHTTTVVDDIPVSNKFKPTFSPLLSRNFDQDAEQFKSGFSSRLPESDQATCGYSISSEASPADERFVFDKNEYQAPFSRKLS